MADEFRHELLRTSIADGTTASNAAAEFRNDTAGMIWIRGIDWNVSYAVAENDEAGTVEISKAPSFQSNTNNSPFFTLGVSLGIQGSTTGAAVDDGTVTKQGGKRWGKGQMVLEPNESMFINVSKDTGGVLTSRHEIEYEFQ